MIRQKLMLTLALILIPSVLAACGGRGDSGSSIWPDVPVPTDARNSDIRLPLPMRLLIQTAVRASARGDDVNVDKFDFVGYTTAQSPQEVAEFYSAERMSAAGWNVADGMNCQTAMSDSGGLGGGFCMFAKDSSGQQSLLIIATGRDDNDRNTNIYFVRFDGQLSSQ
jgi:hypothetical protein